MEKKFSIYHLPYMSFYSRELYCEVGLVWKGPGFLYLFLLLAIVWLLHMPGIKSGLDKFFEEGARPMIKQLPEITIKEGVVSIKEAQPYYIKDGEGNIAAVIDTTGRFTSLDDTPAHLLLTKTQLIIKKNEKETREYDLSEAGEFTLTSETVGGWLNTAKLVLPPIIYICALLGSFVWRMIQALIYALLGLAMAAGLELKIEYEALIRLAVVAVTPAIIIKTIVNLSDFGLPWAWLWYFLIAMGYLFFALRSCHEGSRGRTNPTKLES